MLPDPPPPQTLLHAPISPLTSILSPPTMPQLGESWDWNRCILKCAKFAQLIKQLRSTYTLLTCFIYSQVHNKWGVKLNGGFKDFEKL